MTPAPSPTCVRSVALLGALCLTPVAGAAQNTPPVPDTAAERARVLAVTEAALTHISNEDFAGFTDLMIEGAAIAAVRTGPQDGAVTGSIRYRDDLRESAPRADLIERGFDPRVMISGPMAMVWLPYDFHLDGEWSHCGVDIFTLFRLDEGWRIATITYTVDQPPACRAHPAGPPAG